MGEQLNAFHEGSLKEDARNVVTGENHFERQNACDNLSACEVFNIYEQQIFAVEHNIPENQNTYIIVKEDTQNDNTEAQFVNMSESLQSYDSKFVTNFNVEDHPCYETENNEIKELSSKMDIGFKCEHCEKLYFTTLALSQHIKTNHMPSDSSCGRTFDSVTDLQCLEDSSFLCSTCGETFSTSSELEDHEKIVHLIYETETGNDLNYKCEVCEKEFLLQKYLKRHMAKHGEKNFICEKCGNRFETLYVLKLHQETHSETRPYICKICGSSYKRYRNLFSHRQQVHGIYAVGSRKANKSLRSLNKKKKSILGSFPCDTCKKIFSTRTKLTIHMRAHTGECPFRCETCGNSYSYSSSLYVHQKVVHEGKERVKKKTFVCSVCNKVFSTKSYLNIHSRVHTGEKPYLCAICNRAFSQRTSLINHTALHTDARPYECTFCNKSFRRRETLLVHIRTHTGEKPYICDICHRGFAQLTDMKKHRLKIHNAPPLLR